MLQFLENDLAAFFADFGEAAIVNNGTEITIIFDEAYAMVDPATFEVATLKPRAMAKTADVETLVQGDLLEIRGVSYRIMGAPQPDGTGMTALELTRQYD